MANENKKDFNAILHDNNDMPKFQMITDQKSIEKYGGRNGILRVFDQIHYLVCRYKLIPI